MKFIVDEMIIGLVKWLRVLGFNAVDMNFVKNEQARDKLDSRYFITASKKHFKEWKSQNKVFIPFNSVSEQLNYLNEKLDIFREIRFLSRCLLCNMKLLSVNKSEIINNIPQKVRESFDKFYQCPECKRIYWEGGHVQRILDKLECIGIKINLNNKGDEDVESK
jgi:uncharacterized protein with PIN domain